jgi:serine/threonine protein kinase/Tfp pilus assembly protein PilF
MRVEEWDRVKSLFEAALGLAPEEREAFLRGQSSGNEDLVLAVLSLLGNYSDSQTVQPSQPRVLVFAPGDLLASRFRIVRHVNSGGMGDVYEAYDERLSQRVALKTVRPELLANADAVARFQREVRLAREVAHPNLCRLYEFLEERSADGQTIPCLTMEFLDGETLSSYLRRARPLRPEEALPVICQIAAALDHLHQHGILHRDLKPSNVMVHRMPDGSLRAVVMDFGLAKNTQSQDDLFESSLHFQAGAPYFMSPEQLRGERPTALSDVYAFGLLVDEMVTRSPAYPGESVQALYYAKLWEQPVSPRSRSRELPGHWASVILRCLSPNPAERPQSAGAVVTELERRPSWARSSIAQVRKVLKPIRPRTYAAGLSLVLIAAAVSALAAPPLTIEMLEIANATSDASYNYLCSGLAGEVVRRFAGTGEVNAMILRPSRFGQIKPRGRFTLDGELRRSGGQVDLTLALHDNRRPAAPLWSRRFPPAAIADPLQMENDIVAGTISALQRTPSWSTFSLQLRGIPGARWIAGVLRPAATAEHKSLSPQNNRALDDFMRGRQMTEQMSPEKVTTGISLLQRAVSEDPSFALGYTALANANFTLLNWNQTPPEKLLTAAKAFAQTAITLDPNLAEAYEARALVFQHDWEWPRAREDYQRALKLKPSFALARRHYAVLLTQVGDVEEGLRQARQARQDDPYDESALPGFGLILYIAGHPDEAVRVLEAPAEAGMVAASHNLGESYAVLGLRASGAQRAEYFQKAIAQVEHLHQLELRSGRGGSGMTPGSDRLFAQFYSLAGDQARAAPYLALVRKEVDLGLVSLPEAAWVYAAAGNKGEALTLLEQAVASKDRHLLFIKVYPFVDSLRSEPRFQRILAQMHL